MRSIFCRYRTVLRALRLFAGTISQLSAARFKQRRTKFACCILLAHCRLDVNKVVRKKLGVRRLSFANPELTKELTGMELGGVTPFGLPQDLPLWVDSRVMACKKIILGGGNRSSKLLMPPCGLLKLPNVEVVEELAFLQKTD